MKQFFINYPYIVYSIIAWGYILLFIKWKGIKRLWPAAILGSLILFSSTLWLITVKLYQFKITLLLIFGIPFFYILWGAASGVIFAYYYRKQWYLKLFAIFGFSGIVLAVEFIVELAKRTKHLGGFTNFHEYIFDILILTLLAYILEIFFKDRLE